MNPRRLPALWGSGDSEYLYSLEPSRLSGKLQDGARQAVRTSCPTSARLRLILTEHFNPGSVKACPACLEAFRRGYPEALMPRGGCSRFHSVYESDECP
jgi:hypothetical protein